MNYISPIRAFVIAEVIAEYDHPALIISIPFSDLKKFKSSSINLPCFGFNVDNLKSTSMVVM